MVLRWKKSDVLLTPDVCIHKYHQSDDTFDVFLEIWWHLISFGLKGWVLLMCFWLIEAPTLCDGDPTIIMFITPCCCRRWIQNYENALGEEKPALRSHLIIYKYCDLLISIADDSAVLCPAMCEDQIFLLLVMQKHC